MDFVLDVLLDAVKDTAVLLPFLFITYVAISLLELFAGEKAVARIQNAGHAGPAIGAALGLVPQCGFSAMGAMLFADRIVTLGTLVAVILSTSDEMLPLLVAEQVDVAVLVKILATKAVIGLVAGFAVDGAIHALAAKSRRFASLLPGSAAYDEAAEGEAAEGDSDGTAPEDFDPSQYSCDCGCGEPLTKGQVVQWVALNSAYRTLQVAVFIFAVTLVLTAVIEGVGEDVLTSFLANNEAIATFVAGLVGMIPNCAASVVVTQLYLDGALGFGPMMAGTLVAAGAGYLVLFRTNGNARENVGIAVLLYVIGVASGLVLNLLGM